MDHQPSNDPEIAAPEHTGHDEVAGSLSLPGAVSLGTGVMIGAGIFALTGQAAGLAGDLFPVAFLVAAIVAAFSSYSYVKLSNAYPSSGGVAMFLKEAYGLGTTTGVFAMFMYVSMVINESLVARTFGAYLLQIIDLGSPTFWGPALGVALLVVAFAINLTEIIDAENFALARAAEPTFGQAGLWFTVVIAIIATASGVIASVFAASRMLAMLSTMKEVPHRHLGMPGTVRVHTMVYTVAFAMVLTVAFDLRRIAALGAIFYLIMDIAIHWGLLRHLRSRIDFKPAIVITAIVLDIVVLIAFLWVKASADALILYVSAGAIALIVAAERLFMASHTGPDGRMDM